MYPKLCTLADTRNKKALGRLPVHEWHTPWHGTAYSYFRRLYLGGAGRAGGQTGWQIYIEILPLLVLDLILDNWTDCF